MVRDELSPKDGSTQKKSRGESRVQFRVCHSGDGHLTTGPTGWGGEGGGRGWR